MKSQNEKKLQFFKSLEVLVKENIEVNKLTNRQITRRSDLNAKKLERLIKLNDNENYKKVTLDNLYEFAQAIEADIEISISGKKKVFIEFKNSR